MKKLTNRRKSTQIRKSRLVALQNKKLRLRKFRLKNNGIRKRRQEKAKTIIKIYAPENFNLGHTVKEVNPGDARNKLLKFINKIHSALESGKKVHISFKNTNLLAPSGTLIFVAEFEKIIQNYPRKVSIDYPRDDVVEQLFQHIGLFDKIGLPHRKQITAENVRPWNYAKGNNVDTSQFKSLFNRYSSSLNEDIRSGLFDSMSEAVTNSFQHSCGHLRACNCERNWWMFARQENELLEVVMYDAGIGIPQSLRQKPELREWLQAPYQSVRKKRDTTMIDVAVQSNRTSTKLLHRGKGLHDMLQFVKEGNVGGFLIFSGYGAFLYSAKNKLESGKDFNVPIRGTLIQWQISLNNSK